VLKGVYLSLLMGPAVPVPVPVEVVEALTSAQVTVAAGARSGFQLAFAVAKGSNLERILVPAGFFDPFVRVILVATVNGVPSVLTDGLITRQDMAPSNEVGGSTLTVTGEDLTIAMDFADLSGMKYPAMADVEIVEAVLARYASFGVVPLTVPSPLTETPGPTERVPTQTGTDLAYVKSLASNAGYTFYLDPGPLPGSSVAYWGPEIRTGVPQPALNVDMDAETNVESLSFGFDGLAREQVILYVQQPNSKTSTLIPVPNVNLLKPPLAARPAIPTKFRFIRNSTKLSPVRAALVALGQAAASADAISGSGQLDVVRYGQVLKPRGLVGVRGAGLAYDGLYYVKSVTHSIKPGEYRQSFQLAREGLISITPVVPV
jgi:hypothetical protein